MLLHSRRPSHRSGPRCQASQSPNESSALLGKTPNKRRTKPSAVADDAAVGSTLAAVKKEVEAYYPLYFCGIPTNEPTCTPFRPNQYAGVATSNDKDGDGVEDQYDNCPSVFNPLRPIDLSKQEDQDGVGDECEGCPFAANTTTCL